VSATAEGDSIDWIAEVFAAGLEELVGDRRQTADEWIKGVSG